MTITRTPPWTASDVSDFLLGVAIAIVTLAVAILLPPLWWVPVPHLWAYWLLPIAATITVGSLVLHYLPSR